MPDMDEQVALANRRIAEITAEDVLADTANFPAHVQLFHPKLPGFTISIQRLRFLCEQLVRETK